MTLHLEAHKMAHAHTRTKQAAAVSNTGTATAPWWASLPARLRDVAALGLALCGLMLSATLAQAAQPAGARDMEAASGGHVAGAQPDATRQYVDAHRREILDEFMQLLAIPNIASDRAN